MGVMCCSQVENVVYAVVKGLQFNDVPAPDTGLERLYHFSDLYCRSAITARSACSASFFPVCFLRPVRCLYAHAKPLTYSSIRQAGGEKSGKVQAGCERDSGQFSHRQRADASVATSVLAGLLVRALVRALVLVRRGLSATRQAPISSCDLYLFIVLCVMCAVFARHGLSCPVLCSVDRWGLLLACHLEIVLTSIFEKKNLIVRKEP